MKKETEVSIVKCNTYSFDELFSKVKRAVDLLGGISNFVRPNSRVLIKPNILMAKEPEFGITTNPEVLRSCIRLLKEINCSIVVGDSPSVFGKYINNVKEVYEVTGIKDVCLQEHVELIEFNKRNMKQGIPLASILEECDFCINLPKFKTHTLTILSGAVKNLFGLVVGTYKTELHKKHFNVDDFSNMLLDIYLQVKPSLTIIDGISCMEGDGPATSGKLRRENLILAGSDCVALDSVLAHIMKVKLSDIPMLKHARARGIGIADLGNIQIKGEQLQDIKNSPFLMPRASFIRKKIPKSLAVLARKLIKYYPCVERDNCIACAACVKACPEKIISINKKRVKFEYSKCIACFCCQEVCPNSAIKIKTSLFAKLLGL